MPDNSRTVDEPTTVAPYKKRAFDLYLTFCALGGMIVSDTGGIEPLTKRDFCSRIGIDEKTTWNWKKNTPDFAMRVRARRDEIVPLARETAAFNRLFLLGMSSLPTSRDESGRPKGQLHNDQRAAVDALKTYTGHYSNLQLPVQRAEVKVQGGLMDVLQAAERDGIIEGELVGPTDTNTGTSQETASILPLPS